MIGGVRMCFVHVVSEDVYMCVCCVCVCVIIRVCSGEVVWFSSQTSTVLPHVLHSARQEWTG